MTKKESASSRAGEVEAELVGLLFDALRSRWSLAGAGAGVACYVAFTLRTPVSVGLAACIVLMGFVRAAIILSFPRKRAKPLKNEEARLWARRYGASAITIGLLMSLVSVESIASSSALACVCFAWVAAAAFSSVTRAATVPWIAKSFSAMVLLPTAAAAIISPESSEKIAGLLLIIALPAANQCARHLHDTFCERICVRRELAYRATHDDLTGLLNRAALAERMAELSSQPPTEGRGYALLLLDLDGFKGVNDAYGHFVGDALLREVARRLEQRVDPRDFGARLGGDEFAIVLTGITRERAVGDFAQRLLEVLGRPYVLDDLSIDSISVSIGFACAPAHGSTPQELLKSADVALYRAKEAGRARCVRAQPPGLKAA